MKNLVRKPMLIFLFLCASAPVLTLPGATIGKKSFIFYHESFTLDTLTIYNPRRLQCDEDPLVTASNKRINTAKLRAGSIRWMALSRDLLKRWGGTLLYGDTILLNSGDASIDGRWIIQDTMNKRFRNRGDLLFDQTTRSTGRWTNVSISRRSRYMLSVKRYPERGSE